MIANNGRVGAMVTNNRRRAVVANYCVADVPIPGGACWQANRREQQSDGGKKGSDLDGAARHDGLLFSDGLKLGLGYRRLV